MLVLKYYKCQLLQRQVKKIICLFNNQQNNIIIQENTKKKSRKIYTDASIIKTNIGIGIWSDYHQLDTSWQLSGLLDINRAEIAAIFIAMLLQKNKGNVCFMTDNATSLYLINKKNKCNKSNKCNKYYILIACIHFLISQWDDTIIFKKVKAHSGIIGNEHADRLARNGITNKANIFILPDDIITFNTFQQDKIINILDNVIHANNL